MKRLIAATTVCAALVSAGAVNAKEITVAVTNLTNGIYFTPLMISMHDHSVDVFELGTSASAGLQEMAEGGNTAALTQSVETAGGLVFNDADLLAPGATTTVAFTPTGHQRLLSVVGMLLPTNDGFIGLDAVAIPRKNGTYVLTANGYDAGTEANDELITGGGAPGAPGIPADPGGNAPGGGTGVAGDDFNALVHVHRGIVGGPGSDLDEAVHRFMNPVARIMVTVK